MSSHSANIWAQRAMAEIGARKRFIELGSRLENVSASSSTIQLALKAVEDEGRHAKLCYAMAKHLGHESGLDHLPEEIQETDLASWQSETDQNIVLCEVVQTACLTETINANLLNTILGQNSEKSKTGRIIKAIYEDEVTHGQFGWVYLTEQSEQRDISWLSDFLPTMIHAVTRDELFQINSDEQDVSDFEFGVLPKKFRMQQFKDTLFNVVFPGFEHFDIDTSAARNWLDSRFLA